MTTATGSAYIVSTAPFAGASQLFSREYILHPKKGAAITITADKNEIYIGGKEYRATPGRSNPYIISPGETVQVMLTKNGSARDFAEWEIT